MKKNPLLGWAARGEERERKERGECTLGPWPCHKKRSVPPPPQKEGKGKKLFLTLRQGDPFLVGSVTFGARKGGKEKKRGRGGGGE